MKLHYYPDTDSLYIELQAAAGVDSRELAEGIVADLAADGSVIGLDLDRASRFDLGSVDMDGLPEIAA